MQRLFHLLAGNIYIKSWRWHEFLVVGNYSYRKVFTGFEFAIFKPISPAPKIAAELILLTKFSLPIARKSVQDTFLALPWCSFISHCLLFFNLRLRALGGHFCTTIGNWGKIWSSSGGDCKRKQWWAGNCGDKTKALVVNHVGLLLMHKTLVITFRALTQ